MSLCASSPLANAALQPGFCAGEIPVNVDVPRSIISVTSDSFLTLERGRDSVIFVEYDENADGGLFDRQWKRQRVVRQKGLNHGLALHGGFIYASTKDSVYRWSYTGDNFEDIGDQEEIINNISVDSQGNIPAFGHTTRTLAFDSQGRLYVSVGSDANVDPDSFRSRIRRFSLDGSFPIDFTTGEVFADGVRNEVALAFDKDGVLWGAENGPDQLRRDDLGGRDLTEDNPAEELHRFTEESAGSHYGYPYCFTEYLVPDGRGLGKGTEWAWPSFLEDGTVTDEECRTSYASAELAMQAHSAPLGMTFYQYTEDTARPSECEGVFPFPQEMDGYLFLAFHGSWNRQVPTGYKVVYVPMPLNETVAATGPVDLLAHEGTDAQWEDGFRPVDVDFDDCGRLLVSSDGSAGKGSKIVRVEYLGDPSATPPPSEDTGRTGPLMGVLGLLLSLCLN